MPTPTPKGRGMNKLYWTIAKENVLIDSLFKLSQNPMWHTDYGFRNGYQQQLKNKIEAKLPSCSLKASPDIESKVKWFKQKWCVMFGMLSLSGFSFDNDKMMILCENNVFNEFAKVIFEFYDVNFIT